MTKFERETRNWLTKTTTTVNSVKCETTARANDANVPLSIFRGHELAENGLQELLFNLTIKGVTFTIVIRRHMSTP